jgi:hypothetical protein
MMIARESHPMKPGLLLAALLLAPLVALMNVRGLETVRLQSSNN